MKKQLEKLEGKRVELRLPHDNKKGLLCKALITSTRPNEWYILGAGKEARFIENEVDYILNSSFKCPIVFLKDMNKIPSMLNCEK